MTTSEKLVALKQQTGRNWGNIAEILGVSRQMLDFVRRGDRKLSAKVEEKLDGLLSEIQTRTTTGASPPPHQLLAGGESPRQYTPGMLPPDSAADPAAARRLAAPSFTLTQRERVAQLAVAGYDAAAARRKAAQYETLMQHVAGVAEGGESRQWHRDEAAHIMDEHFGPPEGKQA